MPKQSFTYNLALGSLYELQRDAGYAPNERPLKVEPSTLEKLEKEYDLPTHPKSIGHLIEPIQLLMRHLIEVIRCDPPEMADPMLAQLQK